jgi:hypothetical protein
MMTNNFKVFLIVLLALIFTSVRCSRAADEALIHKIIKCESHGIHTNKDGSLLCNKDADKYGVSCGIAQFKIATFYEFAYMAKKQGKFPFKQPNWYSKKQQLFLLNWGFDNGYGNRWECLGIINKRN